MERLSKVIAQAGCASRRKAENLITEGKVKVNDEVINVLGYKVSPKDIITVEGKPLVKEPLVYYLLNKPTGYLSTTADIHKRRNILDLILKEDQNVRLFPIHKLEYDTSGLLLVTNDGELTKKLTSQSESIQKEYVIRTKGIMIKERIREIKRGIKVENKIIKPVDIAIVELDKAHQSTLVKMIITNESAKELKTMFKQLGHEVKNMTRIRFDSLTLEGVNRGSYRKLKSHEVKYLYRS
ncbi:pseudouridine synthase [Acholeplasma laidlawii]|uniref:rRNA pseudouridylate synthase n=2 Tax=Acholeplasma laidlawii TaxID=2148 RepID=A9NGL0_ACHLI|nr:pseudouridine synthase [Acholeplasma laidlawii]ABX81490.1 rRNA pseudouridylate synthase [Acholeplasma laidlawii PG-8A]NWH09936.1 rRNA pseudouridine synthase [Acholeplasma laidlawii]NWH11326.1 rRNA pseudouridine synthase [Acholeplasma laidlawii]NWH13264.1 rRNA pseudouridine synthase [Acholeplasma laidlawii]NWH14187.1 rRNA pseudouridine synthase [Acholeplasma laidlawii]